MDRNGARTQRHRAWLLVGLALLPLATACDGTSPSAGAQPASTAVSEPAMQAAVSLTSSSGAATSATTDRVPSTAVPATTMPATTTTTTEPVPVTDETQIAAAQRLLLARGYDLGEVDGAVGPATAAAIAAFRTDVGLPADGALDTAVLAALDASSQQVRAQLPASVVIDLSDQRLSVFNQAGTLVTAWPISTGGPGNETPTGSFAVQGRQRVGTAKDVDTVHMDYFTVFNDNIGFHGIPWVGSRDDRIWTPLGQYGVSHGCVRMDDANAQYLYNFLLDGAAVTVQD